MINLSSLFRITPSNYRNPSTLISVLIIIATIANLLLTCRIIDVNSFGMTEFMINFQGGFVRRGAVGEILFQFISATELPLIPLIFVFCTICYVASLLFFFMKFHQRGYCWWLVLCPFFLGMNFYFIRKDFLIYLNFIAITLLLSKNSANSMRRIAATIIAIWTIFIHEAFIFFGGAITILLLITSDKRTVLNWGLSASIIVAFLINCYFKGSTETVTAIYNSWKAVPGINLTNTTDNSIGAIGWNTIQTFKAHLSLNFLRGGGFTAIFFQPLNIIFSYYILTSFLIVFRSKKATYDSTDRTNLSALYVICLICLIPMFTLLSCDYARLYQYASVTAFTCFLVLSPSRLCEMIPTALMKMVNFINQFVDKWLTPNKCRIAHDRSSSMLF